jgi:hypothetical protein
MNRINAKQAVLLTFAATALWGQESILEANGGVSWKGLRIRFVTRVEPPGNVSGRLPGGVIVEDGRVHHLIDDAANKRSFAYDVLLEPASDGNSAQLRIERLHSVHQIGAGFTLIELPEYPVIPNVKVGDTVALDLLINPATGQKIVDYLTLIRRGSLTMQATARDFTLADVEMALNQPRVLMNGDPVNVSGGPKGGVSGMPVWFYLAGHGRFTLSLFPNERLGFKKSGVVSGNALSFRDGSTEYRLECASAIVLASGDYNLYVLHEPAWPGLGEPFTIGAGGRLAVVGK